jgi:hypothetical protein
LDRGASMSAHWISDWFFWASFNLWLNNDSKYISY